MIPEDKKFLLAYFSLKKQKIMADVSYLQYNKLLDKDFQITEKGKTAIEDLIIPKGRYDVDALYKVMTDIFPKGLQDGTGYPWKGVKSIVKDKLRKFFKENPDVTPYDVIEATKLYWSGEYDNRKRRILTYFISKKEKGGEYSSELMEMIERLKAEEGEHFQNNNLITD